uniref:Uncharacterized protein n=1 Tax=Physcomitrium patens TaxID=3218 RepID=A0A7I4AN34_PHYPA
MASLIAKGKSCNSNDNVQQRSSACSSAPESDEDTSHHLPPVHGSALGTLAIPASRAGIFTITVTKARLKVLDESNWEGCWFPWNPIRWSSIARLAFREVFEICATFKELTDFSA